MLGSGLRSSGIVRVGVTVTFLRMDHAPDTPPPPLPDGATIQSIASPTIGFYRYLYNTVGADYVWWLRRLMPDNELAGLLRQPGVSIHVLYVGGEPTGFFELDARPSPNVNLSYFGLLPHAVGAGIGFNFLRHAVATAWAQQPPNGNIRGVTVNTCTADHPRALPNYLRTGFRTLRASAEVWDVPLSVGLKIPDRLRV